MNSKCDEEIEQDPNISPCSDSSCRHTTRHLEQPTWCK